jgi:hypothetical protein
MTITDNDANSGRMEDIRGTLLSLPQCDMERPDSGVSKTGSNRVGLGNNKNKNKSVKTTAKRADFVLFEVPKSKKGSSCSPRKDLWEGRCKILANGQHASLVTPSTSLQLVTIGTSNALVVWKKDDALDGNNNSNDDTNISPASDHANPGEESPRKRRKLATTIPLTVAPCRLIQPGGSGSSFLVGQLRDLDPMELSHFFAKRHFGTSGGGDDATVASISTSELCNLFQVAPNQIWQAMLWIPSVVSKHDDINRNGKEGKEKEEMWQLVPEEEVLFGQRALVETLCEDDDNFENDNDDGKNLKDELSTIATIETMAAKVSQRVLPLLLELTSSETRNSSSESESESDKEYRCLAIARKTVLLSSTSSYSTKTKLNDFNLPFRPDASRIAFYALRDLFLKYPSYAWSDLSEKWSTRLPLGERYERITSRTEWIEDGTMGGHGGLVPNQLVFSSSGESNSNNNEKNLDNSKSKKTDFGNPKAVLSLVDPHAVLAWRGGKN